MATEPNYSINYEDERFKEVDAQREQAITNVKNEYQGMITGTDEFYDKQIQASKDYADKQTELQNQLTEQTIKEINQNKDKADREFKKESMASYADYQKEKFNNEVNMYNMGLSDSGYSESSLVSMYNTYQNRIASAKQSLNDATINYNNQITQAQLANSSALAEIAYNAYKDQLELGLQAFQYKNTLTLDLIDKELALDSEYYNRRQDVLSQINTENSLAEEVRQYNLELAEKQRQFDLNLAEEQRQYNESLAASKAASYSGGGGGGGSAPISGGSGSVGDLKANNYNNNATTRNLANYTFSNGYQPRYVNNLKLSQVVTDSKGNYLQVSNLNNGKGLSGIPGGNTVWQTYDKNTKKVTYYAWVSKEYGYLDITSEVNRQLGY